MAIEKKTNPNLVRLINDLKAKAREEDAPIWRDVAERLEKSSKNWAEVNLSTIQRYTSDGDLVLVPGKVLASGYLTKKLTIGAYRASERAKQMIEESGGKFITIQEMAEKNPKGSGIRIMG